jgi:two-component system, NtrC family, response regulator HupR/HoxA
MGGAHILIVDDDGFFRSAVADSLAGLGYRLSFAEDVPGALAVLRSEEVDVVVADHVMPGLSGLALLTSMREHMPEPRRILVSGHADVATALAAINQAAVFRFVEKPFDPVTIRLAICCAVDDLERERNLLRSSGWPVEGVETARVEHVA